MTTQPVIQTDMVIIRNKRIEIAPTEGQKPTFVEPFTCTKRGYLISSSGQLILAFNPRILDIFTLIETIDDLGLPVEPLEYWVLNDDRVVNYGEIYDDEEPSHRNDDDSRIAYEHEKLEYANMLSTAVQEAMKERKLITVGFDKNTPAPISNKHPPHLNQTYIDNTDFSIN